MIELAHLRKNLDKTPLEQISWHVHVFNSLTIAGSIVNQPNFSAQC